MTRKELNQIKHAAYVAWSETEEAKQLLTSDCQYFYGYHVVQDGGKTIYPVLCYRTHMHDNYLRENGFDPDKCTVKEIFTINRAAQTMES